MSDTAFELRAGGADDLDGSRTSAAVAAYVRAEQLSVLCRLLWRRLVIFAAVWLLLGWFKLVPVVGVLVGLALFVALATGAGSCGLASAENTREFPPLKSRTLVEQLTRS
jgi:hypothetical protein